MFYTIYKTTNTINNKIYIGYHETLNPNDSYLGSGKGLKRAINKYGKDKFNKEILFIFNTHKEMIDKEIELVTEEFISRPDTYNMMIGGLGASAGKNHPNWGITPSQKTKDKIRLAGMGANNPKFKYTKEVLDKLYNPNLTIFKNTGQSGGLRRAMIKHVVDNSLPCVPNQKCIERYASQKRDNKRVDSCIIT